MLDRLTDYERRVLDRYADPTHEEPEGAYGWAERHADQVVLADAMVRVVKEESTNG